MKECQKNGLDRPQPLAYHWAPTYVVESEIDLAGRTYVLLSLNGLFEGEEPLEFSFAEYYPKTWGLLIFDNNGTLLSKYRYISDEMLHALETGETSDITSQGYGTKTEIERRGTPRKPRKCFKRCDFVARGPLFFCCKKSVCVP